MFQRDERYSAITGGEQLVSRFGRHLHSTRRRRVKRPIPTTVHRLAAG
jgi:hypothetical protein